MVGLLVGLVTFLSIGAFHPIVIKCEYRFGKGCWPAFAIVGVVFCIVSVLTGLWVEDVTLHYMLSTMSGVLAFSAFWSIRELFEQEERVRKGWFPANPKRRDKRGK